MAKKLISPQLSGGKKYHMLPSLWLGADHGIRGIQRYSQTLAHQVVIDHFGEIEENRCHRTQIVCK